MIHTQTIYTPDSNIIKAILKGDKKVKDKIEKIEGEIIINGICYYEVKRGLLKANAHTQIKRFDNFCKKYGLIFLDILHIYDKAAEIWAELESKGEHLDDADILIASIVYVKDLVLVTNDDQKENI